MLSDREARALVIVPASTDPWIREFDRDAEIAACGQRMRGRDRGRGLARCGALATAAGECRYCSVPGPDDAGFVGEYDCLDAVAEREFVEHSRYVCLDCGA